jgi:hypothetical protein
VQPAARLCVRWFCAFRDIISVEIGFVLTGAPVEQE